LRLVTITTICSNGEYVYTDSPLATVTLAPIPRRIGDMDLNSSVRYFDLASETRSGGAYAVADSGTKPAPWFPQYIALVLGIIMQPPFEHFRNTNPHEWAFASMPVWIPFALIVAIVIFPAIYKNAFDPTKPIFVQLCTIFASGLGWQALLQTAVKMVS
jgi:hypothetical protein